MNEILAYHGWGFDSNCWQSFSNFTPKDYRWKNFDRGYFKEAQNVAFSIQAHHKIVFTHSFGYHLCSNDTFSQADLVAIFSGFKTFHPKGFVKRRRSKLVLHEMMKQFEEQAHEVLAAFYQEVFKPAKQYPRAPEKVDKELLLKDLQRLNEANRKLPELKKSAKVCIFHGAEDAIVSKEKSLALIEQFGRQPSYFEIEKAGHALPMQKAEKCWGLLKDFL